MKRPMGRGIRHTLLASVVFLAGCASQEQSAPEEQLDTATIHETIEEIWKEYAANSNVAPTN